MGYPLIILGAGASFDCQDNSTFGDAHILNDWHPPLTNSIFDTKRFYDILKRYQPQVTNLASYINNRLKGGKLTFEEILTDLRKNKTNSNSDLIQQLVALRFYLADLFYAISDKYYRMVNNYQTLIQLINGSGRQACIVNFNYDLLFEKAFFQSMPKSVNNYIKDEIKIIKLHGACNWFYDRKINGWEPKSSYEFAMVGAQYILGNEEAIYPIIIKDVENSHDLPSVNNNDPTTKNTYLPAIALPLESKVSYVCPDDHVDALKQCIAKADRIVMIGWKAGDPYLVDLLNSELKENALPIAIACGANSKDTILEKLGTSLNKQVKIIDEGGFSSFLNSDRCEEFLNLETSKLEKKSEI